MFSAFWIIGWQPVCGYTAQITVTTVKTLNEVPKRWKLFMILGSTQFYIRTKL